jgi:dUTP pyrophosphatase
MRLTETVMSPLQFRKLHDEAVLPSRSSQDDAGFDLASVEEVSLEPGTRALVKTGLAVQIPEGHGGLVLPRSGLALRHGISLVNSPGLIDAGYRGEIGVILHNTDLINSFDVKVGDRIAQLMVVPFASVQPEWVEALDDSQRGEGGFGSSGLT